MNIKQIIREELLTEGWLENISRKHTLKTLVDRDQYSYNVHDLIKKDGDNIIIWLKMWPNSKYSENSRQYMLNVESRVLFVYDKGLNREPINIYSLTDNEFSQIYNKIYHLV